MIYGMKDQDWELIKKILIVPLKKNGDKVWIFGSRATGKNKPFSDVDLLYKIKNPTQTSLGFISQLKEQIEESKLPYKIDLVNEAEIAASYLKNILAERIEL